MRYTLILGLSQMAAATSALNYKLVDEYTPSNFFSKFKFWDTSVDGSDGTGGFANYLSQEAALREGLYSESATSVRFGVDYAKVVAESSSGRDSIRLEGKTSYTKGIYVADIVHMPGNVCGSWPAFWSYGNNWPYDGEMDIIEGVNTMTANQYSLHTGNEVCTTSNQGSDDLGTYIYGNCQTNTGTAITNSAGCSIGSGIPGNFASGFNNGVGGFYVTQWTDEFVKHWFFRRGSEPATLHDDIPDYTKFGTPDAFFQGDCNFGTQLYNQHLVFNTNFCGAWAGADGVYNADGCPVHDTNWTYDVNCRYYVGQNPSAFANSYWEVNGIRVFGETTAPSSSSSSKAVHSTSSKAVSSSAVASISVSASGSSSVIATISPIAQSSSSAGSTFSSIVKPSHSSFSANSSVSFHFPSHVSSIPQSIPASFSSGAGSASAEPNPASHSEHTSVSTIVGPTMVSFTPVPTSGSGSASVAPLPPSGSALPSASGYASASEAVYPSASASGSGYGSGSGSGSGSGAGGWGLPAGCSPIKVPYTFPTTTAIVDVCETGLTTSTLTTIVTYCPMCHEHPASPYAGFTETVKWCEGAGCGEGGSSVTVTIPCAATADPVWLIATTQTPDVFVSATPGSWVGAWADASSTGAWAEPKSSSAGSWSGAKESAAAGDSWSKSSDSDSESSASGSDGSWSGLDSSAAHSWAGAESSATDSWSGAKESSSAGGWYGSETSSAAGAAWGGVESSAAANGAWTGAVTSAPARATGSWATAPAQVTVNGASTSFASAIVMFAAAAIAVMML